MAAITKVLQRLSRRVRAGIASEWFFYFIVAFFIIEAAWIALSALYPMAFDEQFHLGLIQLYSHQISPFFARQPEHANTFGAVARDPSYLYHFLMSFPYRALASWHLSFMLQVILLRFINIGLIAASLVWFRRLLSRGGSSKLMVHSALFAFVCVPVLPLLAAQINYDNLLILLMAINLVWTVDVYRDIRTGKFRLVRLIGLLALGMFASLVKYAYLPIFAGIVAVLFYELFMYRRSLGAWTRWGFRSAPRWILVASVALFGLALTLFIQRYGVNVWRYHNPIPQCDQVLSVAQCQAYSPWARNYEFLQAGSTITTWQTVTYPIAWMRATMSELVFTITSRFNMNGTVDYYSVPPLIIPLWTAWTVFWVALAAALMNAKRILANVTWRVLLVASSFYVLSLFLLNISQYRHLGQPIAIHGRYLLPVLPIFLLIGLQSISWVWDTWLRVQKRPRLADLKLVVLSVVLFIFVLEGGGVLSFISLSREDWFWPNNKAAQHVNYTARQWLSPLVDGN
jgi:hypothetical protein